MALIWFESYGNSAFVNKIAFLCEDFYDTIELVTWQVISAIQSSGLHRQHIR